VEPPERLPANQPLAFTLFVREGGDTVQATLDPDALDVRVSGDPPLEVHVSGDGQFLTLVPRETWTGPEGGRLRVDIAGRYRAEQWRFGLKFFGAGRGGPLAASFGFEVPSRDARPSPLRVPRATGEGATRFELSRFAAPNPTMLPSWNQIGFDSLHYLAGAVEGTAERALLWVVAGKAGGGENHEIRADPALAMRFPLVVEHDHGLLTFQNYDGFKINFVGSWDMPFGLYRASTATQPRTGAPGPAALFAVAHTDELEYYGRFLKLMGLADMETGRMPVFGGLDVAILGEAPAPPARALGSVRFSRDASGATATIEGGTLRKADHVFSLLLVDAATGRALPLYYTQRTRVEANADGEVTSVRVAFDGAQVPEAIRAWYLVDTYPAARGEL
jgi:hypothetical protein